MFARKQWSKGVKFRFKFYRAGSRFLNFTGRAVVSRSAEFRLNLITFANIKAKFIVIKPTEILIFRACVAPENKGVAVFLEVLRAIF